MRNCILPVLFILALGPSVVAMAAGFQAGHSEGGPEITDGFGANVPLMMEPVKQNWRVGVQIKAGRSSAKDFLVTLPIPTNWPEQQVTLLEEKIPVEIRSVKHRTLNSGVEQLVIEIPRIQANQLIELTMLYQVTTGSCSGRHHIV